jgi:hypothetical protein
MEIVARYYILPGKMEEAMKFVEEKQKVGVPTAPGWTFIGVYFKSM